MSIGNSLTAALAGLQVARAGIDLTSRNIANANDPAYTRKSQVQSTDLGGAPTVEGVQRRIDTGLQRTARDAASNTGMLDAQARYAQQISFGFGTPGAATSLSNLTAQLGNTFQSLATQPESDTAYSEVVNAAERLVTSIRGLYQQANRVASNAGSELSDAIESVNKNLQLIDGLNKKIIASTTSDTTDLADQRDRAIAEVAEKLDITTFARPDGGISVYTRNGTALVDATANTLSSNLAAGTGPVELLVQVAAGSVTQSTMIPRSGAVTGLLDVINTQVPTLQAQLDDFAGTLTTSLTAIGVELFNDAGATTFDPVATPTQTNGYANRIAVNDAIVAVPRSIRDGTSATPLATGDTTYIDAAVGVFASTALTFSGPGMKSPSGLAAAASDIITGQSSYQADLDNRLAAEQATKTAIETLISTDSGVNLDTEFSNLLQLQQAYAANARIVAANQSLFNTLLVAAGGSPVS
jgi:flagellar hook-associated protein FlgK